MGREPETPNREESMIFHAIEFAARTHSDRYRKGSRVPCFVHPMNAAKILIEYGCPGAVVVAGILPDATEDTSVTIAEIGKKFGEKFAGFRAGQVRGSGEPQKPHRRIPENRVDGCPHPLLCRQTGQREERHRGREELRRIRPGALSSPEKRPGAVLPPPRRDLPFEGG